MDVILVAAGGLAREVVAAEPVGIRFVGMLDDNSALHGTQVAGVPVLGGLDHVVAHPHAGIVLCAGSGRARRGLSSRLGEFDIDDDRYATIIAPGVRVPRGCVVGSGSILLSSVVLTADVRVGRHVVVMPNCTITHDDVLEDFSTLAAGVALGGAVHIRESAYIGMNASIRQGLIVGTEATVGMGAAVITDVPEHQTWAGVPARQMGGNE